MKVTKIITIFIDHDDFEPLIKPEYNNFTPHYHTTIIYKLSGETFQADGKGSTAYESTENAREAILSKIGSIINKAIYADAEH